MSKPSARAMLNPSWVASSSECQLCSYYYSATGTMEPSAGKQLPDYFLPVVGPSDSQRMGDGSSVPTPGGGSPTCEKILWCLFSLLSPPLA
ncbi:unnamed protein product [Boreogadus saida]